MYGAREETCSIFDQIVSPQWRPVACELSKRAWNLRVIRVSLLASAAFLQEPQTLYISVAATGLHRKKMDCSAEQNVSLELYKDLTVPKGRPTGTKNDVLIAVSGRN
ncbi:hypothetical protein GUJ93_ZPchr0458g22582 [Zizania palustris]|uniref:Uncharacterized protein n=1 Tax=Zizania palustris TaxID=103762 RepID=A0A8J5RMG3_ZIZPA|nr:hypothetical protein GUJ93_ZPchr0458g22582 [Zizania palustris]